jgi:DNA-binding response OmpR family regulator
MRVLVIEDGSEYTETLSRFLADGFTWVRAGSGPEGLEALQAAESAAAEGFDAVFLDMRFDRVAEEALLGDVEATADRFNGDPVQARRFLEDHQGMYVLAALREAGLSVPVLLSYDFDGEPRRWAGLASRHGPVDYLPDNASPSDIAARLRALAGRA